MVFAMEMRVLPVGKGRKNLWILFRWTSWFEMLTQVTAEQMLTQLFWVLYLFWRLKLYIVEWRLGNNALERRRSWPNLKYYPRPWRTEDSHTNRKSGYPARGLRYEPVSFWMRSGSAKLDAPSVLRRPLYHGHCLWYEFAILIHLFRTDRIVHV